MNNEWKSTNELPKDGDTIIAHVFCGFVVGWFMDKMDGVSYKEYVENYEADDEDDKPMSEEDYEFSRYEVKGMYYSCKHANWNDVIEWLPLPEVR